MCCLRVLLRESSEERTRDRSGWEGRRARAVPNSALILRSEMRPRAALHRLTLRLSVFGAGPWEMQWYSCLRHRTDMGSSVCTHLEYALKDWKEPDITQPPHLAI